MIDFFWCIISNDVESMIDQKMIDQKKFWFIFKLRKLIRKTKQNRSLIKKLKLKNQINHLKCLNRNQSEDLIWCPRWNWRLGITFCVFQPICGIWAQFPRIDLMSQKPESKYNSTVKWFLHLNKVRFLEVFIFISIDF